MTKKYKLKDAKEYVGKLEGTRSLEAIDYAQFSRALKVFANNNDQENFKKASEKYFQLAKGCGNEALIKESYSLLEGICLVVDTLYMDGYPEIRRKKAKEGSATKLLRKLYPQEEKEVHIYW